MSKAIAVIAGDIHYSLNTLTLADAATRLAIAKANEMNVPFVANGDTHDSKANLRGECVNAMIETFKLCKVKPYVNIGNHCRINEKSVEHALNFLAPYAHIVNEARYVEELASYVIPYYHDPVALVAYLKTLPKNSRLIMHQGVRGSDMGEYVQDKSAISSAELANFRTILSHYHARQNIKCGRPTKGAVGLASFIGSPYTVSFGEASDLPKGFQILMDDGSLEHVRTNLRRHIVLNVEKVDPNYQITGKVAIEDVTANDLVWVKAKGTKEELLDFTKEKATRILDLPCGFRLDLIPTDTGTTAPEASESLTDGELLDSLIDSLTNTSDERKEALKELWRKSARN